MKKHQSTVFLIFLYLIATTLFAHEGGIESLRQTGKAFSSVAQKVSPSVVFIQAESIRESRVEPDASSPFGPGSPFNDELFRRFFGDRLPGLPERQKPRERRSVGLGSGFVFALEKGLLTGKSYVLTNNHVVEGADRVRVKLRDGREFEAKVKGTDPQSDIAVLELEATDIPALTLGDSARLEVGEWVVAIGNPFGLSHTLTAGVVSAKGRTGLGINDYEDFIQTDAAINPGNSGGPLVNLEGEVVGINTAIFSRSGGYMGVGFAIPINMAKGIASQLLDEGEVTRGYLGVVIQALTPELTESFKLGNRQGVLIAQILDGSPAQTAGLRQGDLVTSFKGEPVRDVGSFRNRVSFTPPGSRVKLEIIRDGRNRVVDVTIGRLDDQRVSQSNTESADELGLTVQTLTERLARQLEVRADAGVVVTEVKPGSIAAVAGIQPGTLIHQVNRSPVKTAGEFAKRLAESSTNKQVLLLISRGGMSRFVVLNWR